MSLALAAAAERLAAAGIERPLFEAQLLLAHAVGATRLDVLRGLDRVPTDDEARRFERLVERRAHREPLAYLRGSQEFYGLTFEVTPSVLVPRPETELLVDLVIEKLASAEKPTVVDVGTGSGCIAIAAAVSLPGACAVAIDLSGEALAVAARNAERHGVADRVQFVLGSLLEPLRAQCVEMIVSNPPYIPSCEVAHLQPEVRDWEPRLAVDGGTDGLWFHRGVIDGALRALRPGGWLALETAMGQAPAIWSLLEDAGLVGLERRRDLAGIERAVIGSKPPCEQYPC